MTSTWLDPNGGGPLACPDCQHAPLDPTASALRCPGCQHRWPIVGGLPRLYHEAAVTGTDKLMRVIYNAMPALHDPATFVLTPIMQGTSEARMRGNYIPRMELGDLKAPPEGGPVRILEIGIGAGANLPLVQSALPRGLDVEIWGVDLSEGMLKQCQKRIEDSALPPTRLMMGDAHALPFVDHGFDRVFHIGAMGSYRDPARALAEMARVAKPGTPIVVVDEQLDSKKHHTLYHRAWFKALTFYDPDPHCPTELLPPQTTSHVEEQISRFYYCLTFRA